jgi:predicted nucleotidyltransferase
LSGDVRLGIEAAFEAAGLAGKCELYLFGSRVKDSAKGGDIDLLFLFTELPAEMGFDRLAFLVDLKKRVGERRIDITLGRKEGAEKDEFLAGVLKGSVRLI